jgi:hypothetical protein
MGLVTVDVLRMTATDRMRASEALSMGTKVEAAECLLALQAKENTEERRSEENYVTNKCKLCVVYHGYRQM